MVTEANSISVGEVARRPEVCSTGLGLPTLSLRWRQKHLSSETPCKTTRCHTRKTTIFSIPRPLVLKNRFLSPRTAQNLSSVKSYEVALRALKNRIQTPEFPWNMIHFSAFVTSAFLLPGISHGQRHVLAKKEQQMPM
jgi:hypothetical protein